MDLSSNELIIGFCTLIILSYLYNFISSKIKIPSVLLLISTGLLLQKVFLWCDIHFVLPQHSLELMGTLGLILIVLEASLELKINSEEIPPMRNAFFAALVILIVSVISMTFIIHLWLNAPLKKSLINAVPLSVISSAIAIPSVAMFNRKIKNFIVYESTFSDILGIMLFNYAIQDELFSAISIAVFGVKAIIILVISFSASLLLMFLINKITLHIKFFLILAILILIYAIGKEYHLPSLLLVLVFGLMINNSPKVLTHQIGQYFNPEKLQEDLIPFKTFTEESAFLIRTFFFIIFGFSVNLEEIWDKDIASLGLIITLTCLLIRYLYLRFTVSGTIRITKLFLAPRGLITVILFYSIPGQYIIQEFSIGIVFFVIITTGLMMTISLWREEKGKI